MLSIARRHIILLTALFFIALSPCLHAQGTPIIEEPNYKPTLTFDIVSLHEAQPDNNFRVSVNSVPHSSRFEATDLPLKALVQIAYGFEAPIAGAPEWLNNTFWNIQCRSDEATDARLAKLTDNEVRLEKRNAIRVMLADRMGLQTHLETRNSAIYNLTIGKSGVKMQVAPPPPPPAAGEEPRAPLVGDIKARGSQHGIEFIGSNANMRGLTGVLSSMLQAPVVDKTGLGGLYNYTLQMGGEWSANDPDSYPSIFTAVQEQLGLKLESVHEAVPNLIIDHINKPTAN
jgi:uncharacterized protein (TIGR03435 family)